MPVGFGHPPGSKAEIKGPTTSSFVIGGHPALGLPTMVSNRHDTGQSAVVLSASSPHLSLSCGGALVRSVARAVKWRAKCCKYRQSNLCHRLVAQMREWRLKAHQQLGFFVRSAACTRSSTQVALATASPSSGEIRRHQHSSGSSPSPGTVFCLHSPGACVENQLPSMRHASDDIHPS